MPQINFETNYSSSLILIDETKSLDLQALSVVKYVNTKTFKLIIKINRQIFRVNLYYPGLNKYGLLCQRLVGCRPEKATGDY